MLKKNDFSFIFSKVEFYGNHYRTKVHPIYVLLVNPAGSLLKMLFHSGLTAAIFINSFLGGLSVALAFLFFKIFSKNYINSLLMSLIFGFSSSQLILSSIPETGALAALSLLIMYILFIVDLERKNINFIPWCLAGVLTLGVTALLAIVQKLIYPSADLFFYSKGFSKEFKHISFMIIGSPWKLITEMIRHFFIVNFIAPVPSMLARVSHGIKNISVDFFGSSEFLKVGLFAVVLWVGLMARSLKKDFLSKNKIFFTGAGLCVLFNVTLHSFYGAVQPFVFTGHFTFLVLTFLSYYLFSKNLAVRLLLSALLILMGINNLLIMNQILSIYHTP